MTSRLRQAFGTICGSTERGTRETAITSPRNDGARLGQIGQVARRIAAFSVAFSIATAACNISPSVVRADSTAVTSTGKATTGLALLGADVGLLALAGFGAKAGWLYATVPTALAIGGGIGGYFLESSASPTVSMYLMAGGMALVIPSIVAALSATAYTAPSEDSTPKDAKPADGKKPEARATVPSIPVALVNLGEHSDLRMSMPLVSVRPAFSRLELAKFGQEQRYEVHAPVFALSF